MTKQNWNLGIEETDIDTLIAIREATGKSVNAQIREAIHKYVEDYKYERGEWAKTDSLYSQNPQVQAIRNSGAEIRYRGITPSER